MSAPGHCRHCAVECIWIDESEWAEKGKELAHEDASAYKGEGAIWDDGHCPACDEAERIAQLCDEEAATAGPERLPDHDARAQTWQAAANLARGQR